MRNGTWTILLAICGLAVAVPLASAGIVDLANGNSTFHIDTDFPGATGWVVDGVDSLYQQWFYYRTPGTMATPSYQQPIQNIGNEVIQTAFGDTARITYTNGEVQVQVTYVLAGGSNGSHRSDVSETINITNMTSHDLPLSFFQYSDFDLNGLIGGQSVVIDPTRHIARQFGPGVELSETVDTPAATLVEANEYRNTLNSLEALNTLYDLNDTFTFGPGDATWAFQWGEMTLGPGGSFIISKDKSLVPVPVPAAALLGAIGLGLVGWVKRRLA